MNMTDEEKREFLDIFLWKFNKTSLECQKKVAIALSETLLLDLEITNLDELTIFSFSKEWNGQSIKTMTLMNI